MWGYIYFTDLYILAEQIFFLDADLFFFFWTQKNGYMRSLLGRRGGAWESNTFFLWPKKSSECHSPMQQPTGHVTKKEEEKDRK